MKDLRDLKDFDDAGGFGSPNLARVLPLSADRIQVFSFSMTLE